MLIAAKSKEEKRIVKAQLTSEFEMKNLGVAKKILGMEILRDKVAAILSLSHKGYIEKVLCIMQSLLLLYLQLISDFHLPYVHSQMRRLTTCLEYHILVLWVL